MIYHVPLSREGLQLRLVSVQRDGNDEYGKPQFIYTEKMIHVPFGDGLLLPSTLLHSGHYGSQSNLRFHGILSTDPWTTTRLGYLRGFIEHMYGTPVKKLNYCMKMIIT